MKTIIVWFRNDLRLHDHPALAAALQDADVVVPVFILNDSILRGHYGSSNRNRFLLECLEDLRSSLTRLGSNLVIRQGSAATILTEIAAQTGAEAVYYTADYTPYAVRRDAAVKVKLESADLTFRNFGGRLAVSAVDKLVTKTGAPYKVFTPFYKNWLQVKRRSLAAYPVSIPALPKSVELGSLPELAAFTSKDELSPQVLRGGETAGRQRLSEFLHNDIADYRETNNILAIAGTSRLSSYLHFGCISPLEIETMLAPSGGANAWHRQLAWREFYNYILFHFPANAKQEFQEQFRQFPWDYDEKSLEAWQQGQTGYPVVDASMRQLLEEGWMHNRARLIVGSFLTKDLGLDWRLGEAYFMHWLIDGDEANNNGNWQWIASVGVDPAPLFRRLYNPSSQQKNYDPDGQYVRRFVPELAAVPDQYLAEPWTMPADVQRASNCIIGQDYPPPVVDHKLARLQALDRYRNAAATARQ